jgi:hypothetical protein
MVMSLVFESATGTCSKTARAGGEEDRRGVLASSLQLESDAGTGRLGSGEEEKDWRAVLWVPALSLDPGCAAVVCSKEGEKGGWSGVVWVSVSSLDLGYAADVCSGSTNSLGEFDGSEGAMAVSLHTGRVTGVRSDGMCLGRMNSGGE